MVKKEKQKKSLKLRRRIRKTLGTLCLVSAIVIAAIPVDTLQAETAAADEVKITLTSDDSRIPDIQDTDPIYMTGDGVYKFAYVYPKDVLSGDKIAVIMEYNSNVDENLSSGILSIPNTVDAYKHYDPGTGTGSGYVAVNSKDQFMFYCTTEPVYDEYGNYTYGEYEEVTDEDGNVTRVPVESTMITKQVIYPCYYRTYSDWGNLEDRSLYIMRSEGSLGSKNPEDYMIVEGPEDWRLSNVSVQYINNGGVFAEKGSITTVNIGDNMRGIGDKSFYGCTSIQSVALGAGMDTIGNYAFANCINMKKIELPSNTNVRIIGDHAFYNCQNLTSYVNPLSVEKIGDYCFENCYNLKTIELDGEDSIPNLKSLGNHLFVNCRSIEYLVIPYNVMETLDISMLEGCSSLKYVTVKNEATTFVEGLPSVNNSGYTYTVEDFKNTVPAEFYFEGEEGSGIHKFCGNNAIAFKYMDQEVYEIIIHEVEGDLTSPKATYKVTSANQLILCDIEKGIKIVNMPDTIGPAKIEEISSTSFQNNCYLEKVYIPSSVKTICDSAFQGCHNLEHVIFNEPVNVEYIGTNAFQTQNVITHNSDCKNKSIASDSPVLTFTGPISYDSVPFTYAMDPSNNINVGSQQKTYITYYSGWPSNLTVIYNPETDKNTLTDYPTFIDLSDYADMPYITESESSALSTALKNKQDGKKLTQDEEEIIDSVLNLQLAQGIEAVAEDLFIQKEGAEINLNLIGLNKTITTYSINEILPYTFEGCSNVESIYINGETYSIGDYAFADCTKLKNVEISSTVSSLGIRPFAGCSKLTYVSFQGSENFTCDNSIIYSTSGGQKTGIIQCLETRGKSNGSSTVEASETVGVQTIAKEAFMDCEGIGSVDLRSSVITEIPVDAFRNTDTLYSVYLPETCRAIWADAFAESNVRYLEIPTSVAYIDPDAFYTSVNHPDECYNITFYCEESSNAKVYADVYDNIDVTTKEEVITYTVWFTDSDGTKLSEQIVIEGEDAIPPEDPVKENYIFKGWSPSYKAVSGNLTIVAQYEYVDPDSLKLTVNFYDINMELIDTQKVAAGDDAVPPTAPEVDEYRFKGWVPAVTNITKDTDIYAQYEKIDSSEYRLKVTFKDTDETVLKEVYVDPGTAAEPPANPSKDGYLFKGWLPSDFSNVTEDMTIYAQYEKIDSEDGKYLVRFFNGENLLYEQRVSPGEDAIIPQDPTKDGYTFTGWFPKITAVSKDIDTYAQFEKISDATTTATPAPGTTATPDPNATATPTPGPTATPIVFYTLTVRNGSGSGSYAAGEKVIIIADDPASNQEFSNWTVDPTDVTLASKYVTATVIEMPAKDVLVTANYKSKASSGVVTGSSGNGSSSSAGSVGGSSSGTSTSSSTSTNGTTVVINKNGLSNTGVVAVQVNGSSDNFVMKISESKDASEAVVKALMNKYSDDLSNIMYFPMDITLYDSTGTKQITDTTGLSIDITIPIPDSMITYAGNNKVAAVVDGKLQELTPKFKTISGVSCISFTATHFSPYVIYVDTENLTASVVTDSTPKTGDGIHPKWFLSVGLLCISMVLFLKKDKQLKENTKKAKLA